jgi:metal-responsive CopG/Arc/MetJ family transcriptional regulator
MSAEAKDRTTKRTKERVNVLIEFGTSQSQSTEMDQTVEALGTSRSQFIRDALAEKLAREGKRSTNGKGNDPR